MTADDAGDVVVTVLPIAHAPPQNMALAVEIPPSTKRRLGMDDDRSWVALTEFNRFVWPGPDLRVAQSGNLASVAYGELPGALLKEIKTKLAKALAERLISAVRRTE